MTTISKKTHYVFKSYLKRWADNKGQIHVFNLTEKKDYPSNIKNCAVEDKLTWLPNIIGNGKLKLEQKSAEIEIIPDEIFKKIDDHGTQGLSAEEKHVLVRLILHLKKMQPEVLRDSIIQSKKEFLKNALKNGIFKQAVEAGSDIASEILVDIYTNPKELSGQISKFIERDKLKNISSIKLNITSERFITSNSPVISFKDKNREGTSHILPISPTICIFLLTSHHIEDLRKLCSDELVLVFNINKLIAGFHDQKLVKYHHIYCKSDQKDYVRNLLQEPILITLNSQ
jgi:hypothetical protein